MRMGKVAELMLPSKQVLNRTFQTPFHVPHSLSHAREAQAGLRCGRRIPLCVRLLFALA